MICPMMSRPVIESGATKLLEVECVGLRCEWFRPRWEICCLQSITQDIEDIAEWAKAEYKRLS